MDWVLDALGVRNDACGGSAVEGLHPALAGRRELSRGLSVSFRV